MTPWWAPAASASPETYRPAVELVRDLYLKPEDVRPRALFTAAARELEDRVPWLLVDETSAGLALRVGDAPAFATVLWPGSTDALPPALDALALAVSGAGRPLEGADPAAACLAGMVEALDPHSRVLTDERLDRFSVRLSGTLVGIGASFDLRSDEVVVTAVGADGPAGRAGLRVGDRVARIDGRSTRGMPLSEVSRRVRGDAGTTVTLRVVRDGGELDVVPVRAEVVVPNVTSKVLEGEVGYVAIDHVSQKTVENLLTELGSLADAGAMRRGLLVDLRGNTGGSMKESARLADLFVESGELLRTVGRNGQPVENLQARMVARDDGTEPPIPVAILVDERTASGSEILAGALLELDRAVLVGRRTYGKGTVQKVYDLSPDTRLKLTVARYVLANGRTLTEGGLVPDVTVGRLYDYGTHFDTFLPSEAALGVGPNDVVWTTRASPDLVVELARRAVLTAEAPTRAATLAALRTATAVARADQDAALAESIAGMGVDWSPSPDPGAAPEVDVALTSERVDGDTWRLGVRVTGRGASDQHRVSVELSAAHAGWWDGLHVPIGRVPRGETVERAITVDVDDDVWPRLDEVGVRVRADGSAPVDAGPAVLASAGPEGPQLRLVARLLPPLPDERGPGGGPVRPVEVTVQNLGRDAWSGVEVHLGYPETEGVELVDWGVRTPSIPGRTEHVFRLLLELEGAVGALPLEVTVGADRHGDLVTWPLVVSDTPTAWQAPRIEPPPGPLRGPAGPWTVPVGVRDDGELRSVTVWLDGRKVTWRAGTGSALAMAPELTLSPGAHRVAIAAVDDQGLVTRRTLWVHADDPATVDAGG